MLMEGYSANFLERNVMAKMPGDDYLSSYPSQKVHPLQKLRVGEEGNFTALRAISDQIGKSGQLGIRDFLGIKGCVIATDGFCYICLNVAAFSSNS